MFSSNEVASNLLIVGSDPEGFLIATSVSIASLFLLAMGSIGYIGVDLSRIERFLLIASGSLLAFWIFSIWAIPFYIISAVIIAIRALRSYKGRKSLTQK